MKQATLTSIEAYRELPETKIERMYFCILSLLKCHPEGLTDNEICYFFTEKGKFLQPKTRRNELVKMGFIYNHGKRLCAITKKKVLVWKKTTYFRKFYPKMRYFS